QFLLCSSFAPPVSEPSAFPKRSSPSSRPAATAALGALGASPVLDRLTPMFVACGMAPDAPATPPLIVRASVWIGKMLGQWDLRRRGKKGDAFVAAWKSAWSEGCDARWQGLP